MANASVFDTSNQNFEIADTVKSLSLNAPNGGEQWQAGSYKPITFTTNNINQVDLFYSTDNQHWKFDYTVVWEGKKKLANTATDAEFGKLPFESPDFFVMHFQITKVFKRFEIYGGTENLLDYRQEHPIINELRQMNVNEMTPLAALQELHRMRGQLK